MGFALLTLYIPKAPSLKDTRIDLVLWVTAGSQKLSRSEDDREPLDRLFTRQRIDSSVIRQADCRKQGSVIHLGK